MSNENNLKNCVWFQWHFCSAKFVPNYLNFSLLWFQGSICLKPRFLSHFEHTANLNTFCVSILKQKIKKKWKPEENSKYFLQRRVEIWLQGFFTSFFFRQKKLKSFFGFFKIVNEIKICFWARLNKAWFFTNIFLNEYK